MSFRRMRHVKAREFQGCDIAYDFSNPANLYDATSGGSLVAADGAIARAEDRSGNSAHMLQTTSGYRPLRKVAALNGMDVARFDGSNDYLDAGDVGDMLDKPVEAYVLLKRTGGGGVQGFFGKSNYGNTGGRWAIDRDTNDAGFLSVAFGVSAASLATVLSPQLLALVSQRKTGASAGVTRLRRNAGQTVASGSSYTDPLDSLDTTDVTLLGAYQNLAGTGVKANTYFKGDMGECAKYSVAFSDAQRQRRDCGLARKWRIST